MVAVGESTTRCLGRDFGGERAAEEPEVSPMSEGEYIWYRGGMWLGNNRPSPACTEWTSIFRGKGNLGVLIAPCFSACFDCVGS